MNSTVAVNNHASQPEATREQISRWMDGDIAPHEIEQAMATLCQEEGRYIWAEMHYVGDCVRGLEDTGVGCADRIRQAIASEPTIVAPVAKRVRQHQERGLFRAMSSLGQGGRAWATAAAVAAVGFVGTFVYNDQVANPSVAVAQPAQNAVRATPVATNDEFNAYLRAHEETADALSPYALRQYMRPAVAVQPQ